MIRTPLTALLSIVALDAADAQSRVDQIIDRLTNANAHRDHVMVVAHRGSWWQDGKIILAENSISSIDRAVELGAEIVELDVQKTKDGAFVILHDETLDRTTTCKGPVAEMALAEVRGCHLVIEGTGQRIEEVVPTLEEVFQSIDGRILMNVDIKLGVGELVDVMKIAQAKGVASQLVIKNGTSTDEKAEAARKTLDAIGEGVLFMPILDDRDVKSVERIEATYAAFRPEAIELLNRWQPGTPMTENGGLLFGTAAKAMAVENDAHLWINTLFQGAAANMAGGRGDPIAVGPGLTEEGWGFWVRAGATIFQTDEPEALIRYLDEKGYRQPYKPVD